MAKKVSAIVTAKAKSFVFNNIRQRIGYRLTINKKKNVTIPIIKSPYTSVIESPNPLEDLGEKYLPTKRIHNYLLYYWRHFRDIRLQVTRVLEIGVQTESSIKMWEEFFPNALIYGIDILPECEAYTGGRRKVFIGSQFDEKFLKRVVAEAGGCFDIIIDDGSHYVNHQLKTFDVLFPYLSSHGQYVIEDTGSCVRDYKMKTVKAIQGLVKHIFYPRHKIRAENVSQLSHFDSDALWIDKNIRSVSFYRWICFIERGHNPEDNSFLKK